MWFVELMDYIILQDIEKKFLVGSVGIFVVCFVVLVKGYNMVLLQWLNEQGFDMLIVLLFMIDVGYGVVFVSIFVEIMVEVVLQKLLFSIFDLFDKMIVWMVQKFKDRVDVDYSEFGFEYVLFGNFVIKFCVQF